MTSKRVSSISTAMNIRADDGDFGSSSSSDGEYPYSPSEEEEAELLLCENLLDDVTAATDHQLIW